MKKDVRVPKQKRSIEKKQKIIAVAQQLFNEKGYYGTNTAEIAAVAGFSVCSIYSYFKDKKDIFLSCLNNNGKEINDIICNKISEIVTNGDIYETAKKVYYVFMESHNFSKRYHDDAMSLKYIDEDIRKYFDDECQSFAKATVSELKKVGITFYNEKEQTFLIYSLFQSFEDEMIYNKKTEINTDILVDECAKIITNMLTNE